MGGDGDGREIDRLPSLINTCANIFLLFVCVDLVNTLSFTLDATLVLGGEGRGVAMCLVFFGGAKCCFQEGGGIPAVGEKGVGLLKL